VPGRRFVHILAPVSDPHELLEAGRFEELANEEHPLWRGLALLELGRFPEAARVFEEAEGAQESGTMLEFAGAASWLAGEQQAAAERWIAALDAGHDGPAGAVKPPALLLYAGLRIPDERYVLRGKRLLGKLWKPKLARVWPGPVAGFLLGEVEEQPFLEDGYEDPDLEVRRLTGAHFWAGVRAQDPKQARAHFQESAAIESASALEVEHHLAKGELR
jgi:tetratricopeptide (TPR) repeat protein